MEKVEKLLTVVVPVYKVEPYINKCLDSLLVPGEQLDKLEVIVVNDGTPDRSAEMAREYEIKYPGTFRVIDKENGGHGSAWNRGLKEASGKYLRFLDSDDWFDTAEFSRQIAWLENVETDLVLSPFFRYHMDTNQIELVPLHSGGGNKTCSADVFEWMLEKNEVTMFWGCVYKTEMLKKELPLFMERVFYDDGILIIAPVLLAQKVSIYEGPVYYYLLGRPGQTMSEEIRSRNDHFWFQTHAQVYTFYLNHSSFVVGGERKSFVTRVLNRWFSEHFFKGVLSSEGCSAAKNILLNWEKYFKSVSASLDLDFAKSRFYFLYRVLPWPLFYRIARCYFAWKTK